MSSSNLPKLCLYISLSVFYYYFYLFIVFVFSYIFQTLVLNKYYFLTLCLFVSIFEVSLTLPYLPSFPSLFISFLLSFFLSFLLSFFFPFFNLLFLYLIFRFIYFYLFYYFLFLCLPLGIAPCVQINDLAYVCHTSEGAWTVRDLGPIYSDLWDPFATVELRLLSVRCSRLHISRLVSNVEHYILREGIFPFNAQKFPSLVGSRTRVLSLSSPMFFHCASRPRLFVLFFYFIFSSLIFLIFLVPFFHSLHSFFSDTTFVCLSNLLWRKDGLAGVGRFFRLFVSFCFCFFLIYQKASHHLAMLGAAVVLWTVAQRSAVLISPVDNFITE